MNIHIPERDELVARIPLDCTVRPLPRPRAAFKFKGVYQPKKNQQELFAALKPFVALRIDYACFVDIHIQWQWSMKGKKIINTPHPVAKKRGDVDNLAKAVNDALVGANILADDYYIVGQTTTKAYGPEDGVAILIWSAKPEPIAVNPWPSSSEATNEMPATPPSEILPLERLF